MILDVLKEFADLELEIDNIAHEIVKEHFPRERGSPLRHSASSVDLAGLDQGKITIHVYISGTYGYTDSDILHVDVETFCDPKYLIATAL